MKWPISALDSIAILDRQSIHPSLAEAATPYLGLEHLDGDGGIHCIQTVGSAGLKSSKFQFSDRHVLFGKLRPYLRKIARPEFSGVCSTDIIPILPKDGVSRDYLFYFLRTPDTVNLATSRCSGANLPRLAPKQLASFQIPLPPLAEQRRIARILDAADALRANRREALAQLDTLIQSTFLDMFGDPVTNPMGWWVGRLEDYFSETRAGTCCGPFGSALKKHEYVDDGVPVWGIDNVKPNQFIQERSLFITPAKFAQLRRYSVEPGDILISRAGTVGRMCVAVPTVERSIIGTNLIRLTLNPGAMTPVYFACLYTFCGDRLPGLRASGDDTSYSFLNTTRLKSLVVPLPPRDLQHRFAAIVQSVEQQKTSQRAHLAELDTLFASLQSRAFRGEL